MRALPTSVLLSQVPPFIDIQRQAYTLNNSNYEITKREHNIQ